MINKIKSQYIDKPSIKKALLAGAVFMVIGLLSAYNGMVKTPTIKIPQEAYFTYTSSYSINFSRSDNEKMLVFRISPQDDYYYDGLYKDHFFSTGKFVQTKSIFDNVSFLLGDIIDRNNKLNWIVEENVGGENTRVSYTVKDKASGYVQISRKIKLNSSIDAIGQSIVFCDTCFLTDSNKRIYFNANLSSKEKLNFAESLNLIPVFISTNQFLPYSPELKIIDNNTKVLLTVLVEKDQEVFWDEKYHLLEIKTYLVNNRREVLQIVKF